MRRPSNVLILLLATIAMLFGVGLAVDGLNNYGTVIGGVELMAASLIFIWIGIGGLVMFLLRDRVRSLVQSVRGQWQTKFVIFATLLALAEEAITTTLINLAPLFGSRIAEAYITASSNYLEVVLYNSVIVFVPMFFCMGLDAQPLGLQPQCGLPAVRAQRRNRRGHLAARRLRSVRPCGSWYTG